MKELETERLYLRRFRLEDARQVFENYANDPEVTKYVTWPAHKDISTTEEYLRYVVDEYAKPETYRWAIILKDTGELVGAIDTVDDFPDIKSCEIGYVLGRKWWHQHIMSEAAFAVTRYLLDEGYNRIEACHDVLNVHSGDVMKKIGMHFEGILRKRRVNNRGIVDIAMYSLLKDDIRNDQEAPDPVRDI